MSERAILESYKAYAAARVERDSPDPDPKLLANLGAVTFQLEQMGDANE